MPSSSWEGRGLGRGPGGGGSSTIPASSHAANGNGHLLNTMDNAAFDGQGEMPHRASATVELGELASAVHSVSRPSADRHGVSTVASASSMAPLCKPDLCRAMVLPEGLAKTPAMRPNPWHRYKTILLVATLAGLIIWALAYLTLESLEIL